MNSAHSTHPQQQRSPSSFASSGDDPIGSRMMREQLQRSSTSLFTVTSSNEKVLNTTTSKDVNNPSSPINTLHSNTTSATSSNNNTQTSSTAIILNMNARSVTPQLVSIASNIVGEENVFVTRTVEDAKMAARACCECSSSNGSDNNGERKKYSLVVPVGGDGTLSGWINCMVDEIILASSGGDGERTMSVEEAMEELPLIGYIPMGTGNGLGYVVGCRAPKESQSANVNKDHNDDDGNHEDKQLVTKRPFLSKMNLLARLKRSRLENVRRTIMRLKEVGDTIQQTNNLNALNEKCSIVEMPVMEVTHHSKDTLAPNNSSSKNLHPPKGDLCFFAGAGFDSLMLHDFQQIKAWTSSPHRISRILPSFVKDALSSVAGYCVALVTRTLPQTLRYNTHKIHVEVTTSDVGTLWVDHRRGDYSELAVKGYGGGDMGKEEGRLTNGSNKTQQGDEHHGHLLFSGTTGILAASTTPYYGGGTFALFFSILVHSLQADSDGLTSLNPLGLRLFPYARLIPTKLQLRLGRISPLTGFFNIPKIFEGSYREKSEGGFGCIDFIGEDFEVEVKSERYNDYLKRKEERGKKEVVETERS
eukprot:scaffold2550_cov215-Alexandrium_tamarense.AAC.6